MKIKPIDFSLTYDSNVRKILSDNRIYERRTGMLGRPASPKFRWKTGDIIKSSSNVILEKYSTIADGNSLFTVGAFTSCASAFDANVRTGRYCSIAPHVQISGFRHPIEFVCQNSAIYNHHREYVASYFSDKKKKLNRPIVEKSWPSVQRSKNVEIGHDVWIGSNVKIARGVRIGNGAIVAAHSVVTKNVDPYTVVGGNPAQVFKTRYTPWVSEGLEEIQWWNYDLESMMAAGLDFSDPEKFVKDFSDRLNDLEDADYGAFRAISTNKLVDSGSLYSTQSGVLRYSDGLWSCDKDYWNFSNRVPVDLASNEAKIQRNGDGTVSVQVGDKYVCATPRGKIIFTDKINDWEKFIIL